MMIHLQSATPVDIMHLAEITLMMMPCLVGMELCRKCDCAFRRSEQEVMTLDDSGRVEKRGVSAQLSWFQVGLAVLWQGDNAAGSESLTLRMLVLSVLIRLLPLSDSSIQQLGL